MYRKQKGITITPEQVELVKANVGKMTIEKLSVMLGLPFGKLYQNMKVLKLTHVGQRRKQKPKYKIVNNVQARIIDFATKDGYFDIKKWSKIINY